MRQYRVDLHTHSKLSPDGSIDEKDYRQILHTRRLDFVAITDHNTIEYAVMCQQKIGTQIIVGEEISTQQGHLIGLFLNGSILPGKDVLDTAKEIKSQGGLVYVPHAYDIFRNGIGDKQLKRIVHLIDILETSNGRMIFPFFNHQANNFARAYALLKGYGSDAHTASSLGYGALILPQIPSSTLSSFSKGLIDTTPGSMLRFLGPKYNKLQKLFRL